MTVTGTLDTLRDLAARPRPAHGVVVRALGTVIEARVPDVAIGDACELRDVRSGLALPAEVVGFNEGTAMLVPLGELDGVSPLTQVVPTGAPMAVRAGDALLGRVVGASGVPIDGLGPAEGTETRPLDADPPDPMSRAMIDRPLPTGVRVIDGLLTCAEGQRIGIYGEPGGGKSTLMAEIIRSAEVDVAVVGLIGERGREAREFIEHTLGAKGLARTTIVLATSDRPAMERVKAAHAATAIAEWHRDRGRRVLLMIDSVTRYARALREIGLSAGEPPTRRGYPSSTFARLPKLLERSGPGAAGTITAFYTVLVEGDGSGDPIAEETRGILDGHLVLSAKLGAANHYPAIDVLASRSRVMDRVVAPEHVQAAGRLRTLLARHAETEFLIRMGEYQPGGDAETDEAVGKIGAINAFLRQRPGEGAPFDATVAAVRAIADTAP